MLLFSFLTIIMLMFKCYQCTYVHAWWMATQCHYMQPQKIITTLWLLVLLCVCVCVPLQEHFSSLSLPVILRLCPTGQIQRKPLRVHLTHTACPVPLSSHRLQELKQAAKEESESTYISLYSLSHGTEMYV